jgi:DNA-binding MarR family transcriptional regulator
MHDPSEDAIFAFFNEIGILAQLSAALFERRLPPGFLLSHFSVLNGLVRVRDGRTPLDLARAFQVPKTTMTHTLSGLERAGLITLRPNPADKRSKQVFLTDAGRKFRADAIAALGSDLAELCQRFDANRLIAATPTLQDLRVLMDQMREAEDFPPAP